MASNLTSALSNRFKQKVIPAKVLDVLGRRITVRLSGDGSKLTGITYTGPVPVVGQTVSVDYRNANNPTAIATSDNPPAAITLKTLDCSLPEMPPPLIAPYPDPAPWPDINPWPVPPPTPVLNTICLDDSPVTGPFDLVWDNSTLFGATGVSEAYAWYNCILRSKDATNKSCFRFSTNYMGDKLPNLKIEAIDTTRKVVATGVISIESEGTVVIIHIVADNTTVTMTTDTIVKVEFAPDIAIRIAGFKISFVAGYIFDVSASSQAIKIKNYGMWYLSDLGGIREFSSADGTTSIAQTTGENDLAKGHVGFKITFDYYTHAGIGINAMRFSYLCDLAPDTSDNVNAFYGVYKWIVSSEIDHGGRWDSTVWNEHETLLDADTVSTPYPLGVIADFISSPTGLVLHKFRDVGSPASCAREMQFAMPFGHELHYTMYIDFYLTPTEPVLSTTAPQVSIPQSALFNVCPATTV